MKKHIKLIKYLGLLVVLFFGFPKNAQAVVPPDFIYNIGSQIIQIFSITFLFLMAALSGVSQFIKFRFANWRANKFFWPISVLLVIILSFGAAYLYSFIRKSQEYNRWLTESQAQEGKNLTEVGDNLNIKDDALDQLKISDQTNLEVNTDKSQKFISKIDPQDKNLSFQFIVSYYQNIALGELEKVSENSFFDANKISNQTYLW